MPTDLYQISHFQKAATEKKICPKHFRAIQEIAENVFQMRDFWDQAEICSSKTLEIMTKYGKSLQKEIA